MEAGLPCGVERDPDTGRWHPPSPSRPTTARDSTAQPSSRRGPPLPDTGSPQAAGSKFLNYISLEPAGTDYVEGQVRPKGQGFER
jgi:hypothetical protein